MDTAEKSITGIYYMFLRYGYTVVLRVATNSATKGWSTLSADVSYARSVLDMEWLMHVDQNAHHLQESFRTISTAYSHTPPRRPLVERVVDYPDCVNGAAADLPARSLSPIAGQYRSRSPRSTCFVRMSAGLLAPAIALSSNLFIRKAS